MALFCLANVTGAVKIAGIEWSVCYNVVVAFEFKNLYYLEPSGFQLAAGKSALMDELSIWQIDLQVVYNNETKWQCSYSAY